MRLAPTAAGIVGVLSQLVMRRPRYGSHARFVHCSSALHPPTQ